jgi:hypothetical protein
MMATISQIQKGFSRFVDLHLAGAFDGWQKALVIGGATLLTVNLPQLVKAYGEHPVVAALGVYNPASESVDVDKLYNAFVPHLGGDKLPISIPKVGTIKLGKEEIDLIVKYIKEA